MTVLTEVLARTRSQGRAALIGYLPVGFPDVDTSIDAMLALVEGGCDIVEIGVPYSDPVMDGPTIQRATEQAVRAGVGVSDALRAVRAVSDAGAAVVTMGYWNQVERFGVPRYATELARAGGSGAITPDLIPDEAQEWLAATDESGLDRIFLVAPSSTDARIAATAQASRGFVYASAVMGVTGVRATVSDAAEILVNRVRAAGIDIPVCVGLGVSTGAQAAQVSRFADGVIVGSALVKCLLDSSGQAGVRAVGDLAAELADGVAQR